MCKDKSITIDYNLVYTSNEKILLWQALLDPVPYNLFFMALSTRNGRIDPITTNMTLNLWKIDRIKVSYQKYRAQKWWRQIDALSDWGKTIRGLSFALWKRTYLCFIRLKRKKLENQVFWRGIVCKRLRYGYYFATLNFTGAVKETVFRTISKSKDESAKYTKLQRHEKRMGRCYQL